MDSRHSQLTRLLPTSRAVLACALLAISNVCTLAQGREAATLRLDFLPGGYHAPFFLALERRYYRDNGIDLQIQDGRGSGPTVQVVGSNVDTFGLAGLSTVALAISKGIPLISIGGLIQKDPNSILALAGSNIVKPKDVEGKRGAFVTTSASDRLFQSFAKANDIDLGKVTVLNVSSETRYSALLRGNADFTVGWSFSDGYRLNRQKPIAPPILFSDYGVTMLGIGLFITKETAAKRPKLVKGFLSATVRGSKDTMDDPQAAVAAVVKLRPEIDKQFLLDGIKNLSAHIHTKNSANLPLLVMAKADWDETRNNLINYLEMPRTLDSEAFYTNDFLPSR